MFGSRFFGRRYWGGRYFGDGGTAPVRVGPTQFASTAVPNVSAKRLPDPQASSAEPD